MKVISKKPRGQRFFKSTHPTRPFWVEPIGPRWWFNLTTGEWESEWFDGPKTSSYYAMGYAGYKDIWSLKAAKRAIAKWDVPKGTRFRVMLPWIGYDFVVRK